MNDNFNKEALAKTIRKQIYAIERELRSEFTQIKEENKEREKNGEIPLPTYALDLYEKMLFKRKKAETSIADMDYDTLKSQMRQLNYIKNLTSSSYQGAKDVSDTLEPLKDVLKHMSKSNRDRFWDSYQRLIENRGIEQKFKYEIWDTYREQILKAKRGHKRIDIEDIEQKIINLWFETTKNSADITDEEFRLSFTSKMRDIFK